MEGYFFAKQKNMKRKNWKIKETHPQARAFSERYNISLPLAQVLAYRLSGGDDVEEFLNPDVDHLPSPLALPDMARAVERIKKAITAREKIFVVGDYDVDGVTSCAIFNEFILRHTSPCFFYIPHRVNDGYGLSVDAIEKARSFGAGLIVAFDCGTNSFNEINLAEQYGIEAIVVDHHHPKEGANRPFAFVNPKRADSDYPFKDFSAGALSFKLLQALTGEDCYDVLDLAALSIVCDVVPLRGENRALLIEGLKCIRQSERLAIKSLCEASGVKQRNLDSFHLGFILGPRINAAGRIAHANDALDLFLSRDQDESLRLAQKLNEYNKTRKDIESVILREAELILEKNSGDDYAIMVSGNDWHPGVLGIVASRLAEKYYRPSFVFSLQEDSARGSARSIHSVHLMEVLEKCSAGFCEYGGHKKAAGINIPRDEINSFHRRVNDYLKKSLSTHDLVPVCDIDCRLDFNEITPGLCEEMEKLKPYGEENRAPLFVTRGVTKKKPPQKAGRGFSLWLEQSDRTMEAVVYDKDLMEIVKFADCFDIAYTLEKDPFYNTSRLAVKDLRLT
jgi:single-stranded-DNA-specific exonuclease